MSHRPSADLAAALLIALCSATGLTAQQDHEAAPVAVDSGATSGSFKVLTYNVAGLPPGLSKSRPVQNMVQIGPKLDPYDLVLLQEDFFLHELLAMTASQAHRSEPQAISRVFSRDFLKMLVSFSDLDVDAIFTLLGEDRVTGDGLNRLSRLGFEGHERQVWQACHGITTAANDCLATKGFTFARHDVAPGVVVDVYNVHGDAGRRQEDEIARREQFQQLAEFIAVHSVGRAVIIGGDTNLQTPVAADEETLQEFMAATGTRIAARILGQEDAVDRFFYRGSNELSLTPVHRQVGEEFIDGKGRPLSDHPAIWVEFEWRLSEADGRTAPGESRTLFSLIQS